MNALTVRDGQYRPGIFFLSFAFCHGEMTIGRGGTAHFYLSHP
jgi:hypothetical protein